MKCKALFSLCTVKANSATK